MLNNHTDEGNNIVLGAYQGAIKFTFAQKGGGTNLCSTVHYHHGAGGGAKRSKGVLDVDLLMSQHPHADIIITGHDHNKWHVPVTIDTMNVDRNKWIQKKIHVLRLGSYKKKSRTQGWEVEKNFNVPTLGGWRVDFRVTTKNGGGKTLRVLETKVTEVE